jgi:hypothetical protein
MALAIVAAESSLLNIPYTPDAFGSPRGAQRPTLPLERSNM